MRNVTLVSGVGCHQELLARNRNCWKGSCWLLELLSKDDDQELRGTEGQVQELPHEELLQVDEVTLSDYLTEEQYDNILEMLGKVRLLLEEITANY